jgi:hypothetical protein
MKEIRNIIRKCLSEAVVIPQKSSEMQVTPYSNMTADELAKKLADAEKTLINANPQMHADHAWTKGMREMIASLQKAIEEKRGSESEVKEHYVDTEWSRRGFEPPLLNPHEPLMYSIPHMQAVGDTNKKLEENVGEKNVTFTGKRNPRLEIKIKVGRDGRISEIENEIGLRFPYSVGQHFNRGIETWACVNGFLMDGKDTCPEKKIFGVRVSDVPQGHEWRMLFPNKFR